MVFAELDRRARRERTHRTKLGVQMTITFAYAALGVAFADPVLRTGTSDAGSGLSLAFGLVCAFLALYLAPEGERDGAL